MGRGRQKAKQTKVARKLKYETHEPDLDALVRELTGGSKDDSGEEFDYDSYEIPPATDEDDWHLHGR